MKRRVLTPLAVPWFAAIMGLVLVACGDSPTSTETASDASGNAVQADSAQEREQATLLHCLADGTEISDRDELEQAGGATTGPTIEAALGELERTHAIFRFHVFSENPPVIETSPTGSRATAYYMDDKDRFAMSVDLQSRPGAWATAAITACGSLALKDAPKNDHPSSEATHDTSEVSPSDVDFTEYEDFAWDDAAVDGYALTFTQKCGGPFAADEPTHVWVEGGWSTTSRDGLTMPTLHERIVARDQTDTLVEVVEGPRGELERATIRNSAGDLVFCFELIDFTTVQRDADGRMLVPLVGPAESFDRTSTQLGVGVSSCNGSPSAQVVESDTEIIITATSWIPEGNGRDGCLDGVAVELDRPIGDRTIVDGLGQRPIGLLTQEDLLAPKPLEQIPCEEDAFDCRVAFATPINSYSVSCKGVPESSLTRDLHVHASGVIDGEQVDVIQIKSVGTNIMLAVSISANCPNSVPNDWSVATRVGNDPDQLSRFLCSLVDLSEEQRTEERCERFEN